MEFAIKWMYSVDADLKTPYETTLVAFMNTEEFRDFLGSDELYERLNFIRKTGNDAAHGGKKITVEKAKLCIVNLYIFMDFVACCYSTKYNEIITKFDPKLLDSHKEPVVDPKIELDFEKLRAENEKLRAELTATREAQKQPYVPKPLDISEFETRRIYIHTMLEDAGWKLGDTWIN